MKKIFTSLLTFAFLAVAGTSWAQTDVTSTYIKNPGFEDATAVTANIRTYAKDKATETDETSGLQEVADWTAVNSGDGMAAGAFAYGDTTVFLSSNKDYKAPATAPTGGGNNALGLVAVWSQTAQYTQAATLPAGTYTLTADIYNSFGGITAASKDLFGFITDGGTEYLAIAKSYTANTWATISVTFTLAEETSGKFSIGYTSTNIGSADAQHLFYDNLKLTSGAPEGYAFGDGTYYLYDEEAKLFFSRGCAYGSEASADKYGIPLNFKFADGAYTISPYDASGKYVNGGGSVYTDQSTFNWTIAASGEGYTLATSAGKYMSHASGSLGEYVTLLDEAKVWKLLTKAQRDAIVNAYPDDNISTVATAASLEASTFETTIADYVSSFVKTIAPTDYTYTKVFGNAASSGTPREVYQGVGNFTYSLTDLTPGIYKVSINAFERDGFPAANVTYANAGYYISTSYLKANDQQVCIKAWAEDRAGDTNPNSVSEAKTLFDNGKYLSEVYVYVGEDGKLDLTVGVPSIIHNSNSGHWFIMGNTVVTLYQDAVTEEQSEALITTATELTAQPMETATKTALDNASTELGNDKTNKTKYQTLSDAVAAAQASVSAYAAAKTELDRRKTVVESENNVYTADALNTYYTEPLAKYNNATLTDSEAKALVESWDWRKAVQTNAFLGSAFGVSDYSGVPYINTWSTEGNSDGSNFKTPFYEYWAADKNALADKTLTATLTDLTAGEEYAVSAWVRVRLNNSATAPATGITLQVNDGDAVAITGTQVGDSRLYLDNYTVYGTVDSDGKLEIKFNVASTNVSWLAFQNLHYAKVESVTLDETKENGLEPLASVAGKPAEVTFTRNFTKDLNSTICLPYDVTPDANAGTFYTFAGVTEENGEYVVTMSENTATTLTANTPYLFKPAGGEVTFTGKIAKVADTYTPTDVTEGDWTFAGSYNKVQWNAESAWEDYTAVYCYSMSANATGISDGDFVKVKKPSTGFVSTPFRCMMKYKAAASEGESVKAREMNTIPSSMKVVLINADGTSTAIDAIDVETEFADGAWYTIDGRKLQGKPAVKGIYINGGQKVLIK